MERLHVPFISTASRGVFSGVAYGNAVMAQPMRLSERAQIRRARVADPKGGASPFNAHGNDKMPKLTGASSE